MSCNAATICKVLLSIGWFATAFVLLASDFQSLVFGSKTALVEDKWTTKDLATLARTNKVAAAVSHLTNSAYESGTPVVFQVEG